MKKRPRDANQLAKLIVDIATGEVKDREPKSKRSRGGLARAEALTGDESKEIATKAANARWKRAPSE